MKIDEFCRIVKSEVESFDRYVDGHKVLRTADISSEDWFQRFIEYAVLPEDYLSDAEEP